MILGTDYPFPLGEVQIVDTWPGKVGGGISWQIFILGY